MEKETKHTLNDAKQVIARKYGYVDWHQMKAACKGYEGDIDPRMLSNSDEAAELYASTIQTELSEMKKENASLQSEIDRLKNDLLDALDLKEGNGPTSLSMLKGEIDRLKEERQELVKIIQDCKPAVLHCYEQSSRNGAHQEFLSEDRDLMRRMEEATRIK